MLTLNEQFSKKDTEHCTQSHTDNELPHALSCTYHYWIRNDPSKGFSEKMDIGQLAVQMQERVDSHVVINIFESRRHLHPFSTNEPGKKKGEQASGYRSKIRKAT